MTSIQPLPDRHRLIVLNDDDVDGRTLLIAVWDHPRTLVISWWDTHERFDFGWQANWVVRCELLIEADCGVVVSSTGRAHGRPDDLFRARYPLWMSLATGADRGLWVLRAGQVTSDNDDDTSYRIKPTLAGLELLFGLRPPSTTRTDEGAVTTGGPLR